MSNVRDAARSRAVRLATLILAALVAGFVPVMQMIFDHGVPRLTKPMMAGLLLGAVIAAFCCLPLRWNVRLLLVSCMGVLTLGLAELACGLMMSPVSASIYDWDSRCLYKPRPNTRKLYRRTAINGGQTSEVVLNSQGFRGPELQSKSDVPRVVVYGDSFIEAEYSPLELTFVEQLREKASTLLARPVEVINAGVNGYGPDQELLRMESELPVVRPQLVVWTVFADNDFGDLMRNKLFRLSDAGDLVENQWIRSPECQHPGMRGPYEPTLWKLARNAIRGAQSQGGMVESYMEKWRLQCQAEYNEFVTRRNNEVHDLQADHYDADMGLTPGVASALYKGQLFSRVLERVAATCKRNQAKLLVVVIPSPADLIEGYDFCALDRGRYPEYNARALTSVVVRAADEHGVRCVNLYDGFAERKPETLYFRGGDNHWNDDGQRVAADIVVPFVAEVLSR